MTLTDAPRAAAGPVTAHRVRALAAELRTLLEREGPAARARVHERLRAADREWTFSPAARREFQQLLAGEGIATAHPIELPLDDEPYWFRGGRPLAGFRSRPELPARADVVVIGAGLTGASAAYHLGREGAAHVVVLERADPAGEASGRNGGNFEIFPENSVGVYEGLARERLAFLRRRYPGLPAEVLQAESERQASLVLGLSLRNRELLRDVIVRERIDCDFSPRGWLHLACTEEEEQGLCEEVMLAAQHGQRVEIWSRRRIRTEFGIESEFLGRFIPGDGTYHPYRFVCGLLRCALRDGVELHTGTPVTAVRSVGADEHHVVTARGTIMARRVVVATNAFTRELFPELRAIRPHQSQIMVTEHAPDRARGRVVTCEDGPTFFNQPREGARDGVAPLLMGGGDDRPMRSPASRRRSPHVHRQLLALRDRFYPELHGRPPSAEWVGPMAFTPDELPAIGFLRPGVIVAAGYNGYGGSYTTAAGLAAARMALRGTVPEWVPEDVFSPRRLLSDEPIFMTEHDSLWRIATSLCRQLQVVDHQIVELLALRSGRAPRMPSRATPPRVSRMVRASELELAPSPPIDPALLAALPGFRDFTREELERLLQATTRLDLPKGTLIFREGDAGDTCFILVRGVVDVSIKVRDEPQLLAQLAPGAVFGQVSLVAGAPRTASCSVRRDALLAELGRDECEALLADRSPASLKFLATLNRGLITALRSADRRLMQLDPDAGQRWDSAPLASTP